MELVSMKCPNCNALIYFDENQERCFCSHCGSQIMINDSNSKKYTYTKVDVARIKEAESNERIRKRELDLEENRAHKERTLSLIKTIFMSLAVLAVAGVILYIAYLSHIDRDFGDMLLASIVVIVGIIGFVIIMVKA